MHWVGPGRALVTVPDGRPELNEDPIKFCSGTGTAALDKPRMIGKHGRGTLDLQQCSVNFIRHDGLNTHWDVIKFGGLPVLTNLGIGTW